MASSDALPVPRKNVAFRVVFPILDADGDLVTGATSLDSEVSKDQGTFADCTNEATEIATSSGMYYLDLTSTEMNADCVAVIVKTASAGAKTTVITLYPEETGDIRVNITAVAGDAKGAALASGTAAAIASGSITLASGHGLADGSSALIVLTGGTAAVGKSRIITFSTGDLWTVDPAWNANGETTPSGTITYLVFALPPSPTSTVPAVNTTHAAGVAWASGAITAAVIATDAIDADALKADAVTEIQSGLATAAALTTIDDFLDTEIAAILAAVDTEVAAIKAVTDLFTAAQAEPTAAPAANATPMAKIAWLAALARNKITQTATTQLVKADDGTTTIATSTVSDDGTTFTRGEFA